MDPEYRRWIEQRAIQRHEAEQRAMIPYHAARAREIQQNGGIGDGAIYDLEYHANKAGDDYHYESSNDDCGEEHCTG